MDLVIFDCDGVLVDSEIITNRVFAEMLGEVGLSFSLEDIFDRFVGRSMSQCCEIIAGLLQRPVPPEFVAQYHLRCNAALGAGLTTVDGIEGCLDLLEARGIPYCVASNGTPEKMQMTLGLTGLAARLEGRRFSVVQVARGKPAPDLFLHASAQFGVMPADCVVIEDTPTGVTAGVAAGMTVFGYSARTPALRLQQAGAHRTFDEMRALPELILGT